LFGFPNVTIQTYLDEILLRMQGYRIKGYPTG